MNGTPFVFEHKLVFAKEIVVVGLIVRDVESGEVLTTSEDVTLTLYSVPAAIEDGNIPFMVAVVVATILPKTVGVENPPKLSDNSKVKLLPALKGSATTTST